ncbi:cadherin-like beta sandwich domain-containing protein [Paenibacillus piri]|uniref:cadherin-like beta sandwich domain-containing protein n=1 Tax=Paenibacillus piri TaxID=2547395 RepID=UPI00140505E8|nr:cadherin-like beta sandwich domain-containing protein [Paenibacillus piri]
MNSTLSFLFVLTAIFSNMPVDVALADSGFAGGDGSMGSPYLIADATQLNNVRNNLNANYKLTADIDLSAYAASDGGKGWKPVEGYFGGTLDGDGHKITGLKINRGDVDQIGLFEMVFMGKIINLRILQANVIGKSNTGILAGTVASSTLQNVYASGDVKGEQGVGGLVGNLQTSNVSYTGSSATVYGSGDNVGGLVGYYYDTNQILSDSYAEGDVHGAGSNVGGLVGFMSGGTIQRSYASGNVVGDQSTVGGLIGQGYMGTVQNSYSLGSVSGAGTVGGLVGYLYELTVINSYAAGSVTASGFKGGLGGYSYGSTVTNSFWDESASGTSYSYGWSSDLSGVTGLSTANMYQSASFTGWDFSGTWAVAAGKSYPFVQSNAPLWLTGLTIVPDAGTAGTMAPGFNAAVRQYDISVTGATASLTITAPAANPGAIVRIAGGNTLITGDNVATVTVSDANESRVSQVYTIHIHKLVSSTLSSDAQLSDLKVDGVSVPGFGSGTLSYSVFVPSSTSAVSISAIPHHPDAAYTVTGGSNLIIGSNIITVKVTASDGTVNTYTVTVIRNRFAGGDGTAASPFLIATAEQLDAVRLDYQKAYQLIADIDLSSYATANGGQGWEPIYFEGSLDGNGHRITGLTIQRPTEDQVGLFNYIYIGSAFNLEILQASVVGQDNAGILVGWLSSSTATNVRTSGNVTGRNNVGGLTGYVTGGSITSSSSLADVTGSGSAVGGLVGNHYNYGRVETSFAEGSVHGSSQAGGLVGNDNYGTISNSYATGQVVANNASAGGLIGRTSNGTYTKNYAAGKVLGGSAAGGLVGTRTSGTFTNNYWNTTSSGRSNGSGTGTSTGLTGYPTASMKSSASYSTWDFSTIWNIVSGTTTPYLRSSLPLWLSGLTVTADSGAAAPVSPSVDNLTFAYSASVAGDVHNVTVTGTAVDPTNVITVSGGTNLAVGDNSVAITVASSNGIDRREYTLNVKRSDPSAAGLSALTLSSGTLSPSFSEGTTAYSASVAYGTSFLNVTPSVSNAGSTVKVNGAAVVSGQPSGDIALSAGATTTITIEVTSQDGTNTKTYTLAIARAAGSSNANLSALTTTGGTLSPTFSAAVTNYTASGVSNGTSTITVRPTVADSTATVKASVNGGTAVAVTSGQNSVPLSINVGSNTVVVTVTAQDGTAKDYTITVTRAASTVATLSGLTLSSGILSPSFSSNTAGYSSTVANSVSSITIKPTATNAGATLTVSVNGGAAAAVGSGQDSLPLALNTGSNSIVVIVTAQDGSTTKQYTITVTRSKSTASDITSFRFEGLTPAVTGTISGTAIALTVPYGTDTSALIATFTNSVGSTVQVGSTAQTSGITPNNFSSPVTYKVTAEDGTTTKSYTVTVSTAANTEKDITSFSFAEQTGPAVIDANAHTIAIEVAHGTNLNGLAATFTLSAGASAKVGTVDQVSGVTTNDFTNPVTFVVKAADNSTQSWTITVTVFNTVTYDSNGSTEGSVPIDGNTYIQGATVTVLGNTGNLAKTGYTFAGWNTQADGNGTSYAANATFTLGANDVTLYAQWTTNSYTVAYHGNGHDTGSVPAGGSYNYNSAVTVSGNIGNLAKTGYTFAGWNTQADGNGTSYAANATFTLGADDVTLYAQWTTNSYTVTYHGNGHDTGSVPAGGSYNNNSTVTVSGNTGNLAKTGYTFAGWNTQADGNGTSYAANATFTLGADDVTLYAQWTTNSYTVSFNSYGGSAVAGQTVTYNAYAAEPTAPTKSGNTFGGWYSNSGLTAQFSFETTPITRDMTLYAKWITNQPDGVPLIQSIVLGDSNVTINWTSVPGATGYNIYQSIHSGSYSNPLTTVSGTVYSYQASGLTNGTRYYFVVRAVNAGGESGASNEVSAMPQVPSTDAPQLLSALEGNGQVSLNWSPVPGSRGYKIYQSVASATYGTLVTTVSGSVYNYNVTGLANGTTYYFTIRSVNPGGDSAPSNEVSATPKTVPAVPTGVTATAGNGQAAITFAAPADNGGSAITGYEVTSSQGNITARGTASPITIAGLVNGTTYTFTVKAINSVGSSAASDASNAVTPRAPSSSSRGSSSIPAPPSDSGAVMLVNGQAVKTTASTTKVNDRTVTTITIDEKTLDEKLASAGEGVVVTILANTNSDAVVGELNGRIVKNMAQKNAVVEIKTENAAYTLPAQQININTLSDQFGKTVALQDIKVQIEIAKPPSDMLKIVENLAAGNGFAIVAPPLSFTVKAIYEGKTIEVSTFNVYVERTIAIPDGVDPNKIMTGVVVDPDGTVRHVPTRIVVIDGKYYAKIHSLTNSTYSVVWHPIEFRDVENHWAKNAVNDMGARMVIDGTGDGMFNPDRDITRAEFAAIVVRALGLKPENGATTFSDVKATDWYNGVINTAHAYHLISGFEDATFRPNDKITREQAMVIIAKAMTITNLKAKLHVQSTEETLRSYRDAAEASPWAQSSIVDSVQSGIVSGRSGTELVPKDYMTRAEVAAIVQRLLQKSELI